MKISEQKLRQIIAEELALDEKEALTEKSPPWHLSYPDGKLPYDKEINKDFPDDVGGKLDKDKYKLKQRVGDEKNDIEIDEGLDALASLSPEEIVQLIKGIAHLGFTFAAPAIATGAALPYVEKHLEKKAAAEKETVSESSIKRTIENFTSDVLDLEKGGQIHIDDIIVLFEEKYAALGLEIEDMHGMIEAMVNSGDLSDADSSGYYTMAGVSDVSDEISDEYNDVDLDVLEEIILKELSKK